jgi:hypothetical protein
LKKLVVRMGVAGYCQEGMMMPTGTEARMATPGTDLLKGKREEGVPADLVALFGETDSQLKGWLSKQKH